MVIFTLEIESDDSGFLMPRSPIEDLQPKRGAAFAQPLSQYSILDCSVSFAPLYHRQCRLHPPLGERFTQPQYRRACPSLQRINGPNFTRTPAIAVESTLDYSPGAQAESVPPYLLLHRYRHPIGWNIPTSSCSAGILLPPSRDPLQFHPRLNTGYLITLRPSMLFPILPLR
jgi:hypothetical protein